MLATIATGSSRTPLERGGSRVARSSVCPSAGAFATMRAASKPLCRGLRTTSTAASLSSCNVCATCVARRSLHAGTAYCCMVRSTLLAGRVPVIKSLDEQISKRPFVYLPPTAPRGPADQLKAPELLEAAARK